MRSATWAAAALGAIGVLVAVAFWHGAEPRAGAVPDSGAPTASHANEPAAQASGLAEPEPHSDLGTVAVMAILAGTGEPLAGVPLILARESAGRLSPTEKTAVSDARGRAEFAGLEPGMAWIVAARAPSSPRAVLVESGKVTSAALELRRGFRLEVTAGEELRSQTQEIPVYLESNISAPLLLAQWNPKTPLVVDDVEPVVELHLTIPSSGERAGYQSNALWGGLGDSVSITVDALARRPDQGALAAAVRLKMIHNKEFPSGESAFAAMKSTHEEFRARRPSRSLATPIAPPFRGVVVTEAGMPIVGAELRASSREHDFTSSLIGAASTDAEGRFSMGEIAEKSVYLEIEIPMTETALPSVHRTGPLDGKSELEHRIVAPAGVRPAYLHGRVVDDLGRAPAFCTITAEALDGRDHLESAEVSPLDGSYRIGPLFAGKYELAASSRRGHTSEKQTLETEAHSEIEVPVTSLRPIARATFAMTALPLDSIGSAPAPDWSDHGGFLLDALGQLWPVEPVDGAAAGGARYSAVAPPGRYEAYFTGTNIASTRVNTYFGADHCAQIEVQTRQAKTVTIHIRREELRPISGWLEIVDSTGRPVYRTTPEPMEDLLSICMGLEPGRYTAIAHTATIAAEVRFEVASNEDSKILTVAVGK
ncbi:MAG: carboxypeptidase regulatory-like domain-containing protein [Planctomycetes bacterium]|nr:carboxypeptidase regulatory-like domain-containing protein [Planctomycetota bacterium]